ncbi:MAG: hypothetical protein JRG76_06285 [Deltaproteobacteria bacterium]|nr:hypothetical protein [Deltaproteobacteria bacterium]MBW2414103.1 hypothetical protein [Deltaproteobacteria bacterium]
MESALRISVPARPIGRVLWSTAALLIGLGLFTEVAAYVYDTPVLTRLDLFFNLAYESNVPTWFSFALLFLSALLLFAIFRGVRDRSEPLGLYWLGLSIAFFYISCDEAIVIHEGLNDPLRESLGTGGVLYYPWVLPVGIAVAAIGLAYLRFLRALPSPFGRRFMVAGSVYVTGALLLEFPTAAWYERYGEDLGSGLWAWLSESFEIAGLCLFFLALLAYVGEVRVVDARSASASASA